MKRITVFLMTALVSLSILLPKERPAVNNDKARIMHDGREYAPNRVKQNSMVPTREDIIYSDDFEGERLLQRHKRVNRVLAEELENQIHALALHTYTASEWQSKHGDAPMSPPCKGGSAKTQ